MTRRYFQPTYVKKFRCDGRNCGAACCRAGWEIEIDDGTYKKYSSMKNLPQHFTFNAQLQKFCIEPSAAGICPYLDADYLCSIQKKYGEEFLSETCRQYPRQTFDFGNYFERSLSLVCPLAAGMILNSARIEFEWIDVDDRTHQQSEIFEPNVPIEYRKDFVMIQRSAIEILQYRALSIADRLTELGRFFMVDDQPFRAESSNPILIENYLVHEFFINAYPWRFDMPIEYNLKIFFWNAEEILRRSPTVESIRDFVTMSNHDMDYISEQLKRLQFD